MIASQNISIERKCRVTFFSTIIGQRWIPKTHIMYSYLVNYFPLQWWQTSRRPDSPLRGLSPKRSTRPDRAWSAGWWTPKQDAPGKPELEYALLVYLLRCLTPNLPRSVWSQSVCKRHFRSTSCFLLYHFYSYRVFIFKKNAVVCVFSSRLVRGEGEIIEEIVSREKHKDINKVREKL